LRQRFKTLKDAVEHHMDEEEDEAFALAREVAGDERAESLKRRFRDRKAVELKEAS
jgi:hypothetical protein